MQGPSRYRVCGDKSIVVLVVAMAALLTIAVGGCCAPKKGTGKEYDRALPSGTAALVPVPESEYPDFTQIYSTDPATIDALDQSLSYFSKPSSHKYFPYQTLDRAIEHETQVASLERLRAIYLEAGDAEEFATRIKQDFNVYRSVGWDAASGEVLFTGYYTPIFEGRVKPDAKFRYPLYRRPADLVTDEEGQPLGRRTAEGRVVSYYSRSEIETRGLLRGSELVYLADPFQVYIVHVQGSARIQLPDRMMYVGYAGKTDRAYKSIGTELVNRGKFAKSDLSLKRLIEYFRAHPEEVDEVLALNESYVFFTDTAEAGPFGSIGVAVTPEHSIATDKQVFPRGGPVIAVTSLPTPTRGGDLLTSQPHTGLYFDQDTGGAIKSAGRADLYLGVGPEAENIAGHVKNEGRLFYIFLKEEQVAAAALRPDGS
ncbi:MAG: murein transglycosylase A [Planctomycetota bacterium]